MRANYQGRPIVVESFSAVESARVRTLPMAEGDGARALREMGEGKGAIVSESFQSRFGKQVDDSFELITPSGPVTFKVLGIYIDYSSDIGSVLIDRALYKKYWRDELVDAFDLWLEPGADMPALIQKIKEDYGEKYQLFISTHRELKDAVVRIMEQSFVVNYAVEIVAVVVAIFSVINTLLGVDPRPHPRDRRVARHRRDAVANTANDRDGSGWMGLDRRRAGSVRRFSVMAYHHVVYQHQAADRLDLSVLLSLRCRRVCRYCRGVFSVSIAG